MKIKHHILFVFCCWMTAFVSVGQWVRVSQFNISDTLALNDIYFSHTDTGFAVLTNSGLTSSLGGRILKTEDGGQSWDTIKTFQDTIPMNVVFTSDNIGYVACRIPPMTEMGIMKTEDGGDTWNYVSAIVTANVQVQDIYFYNDDVGIYSTSGYSSITYDGGYNWSQITSNPHGGAYRSFLKDSIYIGTGGAILFYTTDTSQTYQVDTLEWGGSSVYLDYDEGVFYIAIEGNQGFLYDYPYFNFGIVAQYDINNGFSSLYHLPYQRTRSIKKSGDNIYLGTRDLEDGTHRFLKSEDGGQTWWSQQIIEPQTPSTLGVRKIVCVNDTVCYGMDGSYLYKTTNGGGALIEQKGQAYVSVEENTLDKKDLLIYPNPTNNFINIDADETILALTIADLTGKILFEKNISNKNYLLPLVDFSQGTYLITIHTKNGVHIKKIVKQ